MTSANEDERFTHYGRMMEPGGSPTFLAFGTRGAVRLDAAPWQGGKPVGEPFEPDPGSLLCPVTPTKIVAIGRNYGAHAAEMGGDVPQEPLLFLKPPSSLIGPGQAVRLPRRSARVDYEVELGVVIGKRVRNVGVTQALDAVFGYTPLCDVTARDLQREDGQWTRAKGFDTFCPAGPFVHVGVNPARLRIALRQNGVLRQEGNTGDMVHNVAALVAYSSSVMTLEPGDVIATGTPAGIGPLAHGDRIVIEVEGLVDLTFPVVAE